MGAIWQEDPFLRGSRSVLCWVGHTKARSRNELVQVPVLGADQSHAEEVMHTTPWQVTRCILQPPSSQNLVSLRKDTSISPYEEMAPTCLKHAIFLKKAMNVIWFTVCWIVIKLTLWFVSWKRESTRHTCSVYSSLEQCSSLSLQG